MTLLAAAIGLQAVSSDPPRPTVRAGVLPEDVRLDGRMDEPAWASAETIADLTMVEPVQGAAPTARTEVRVLAGAKAIVIGIVCDDPQPDRDRQLHQRARRRPRERGSRRHRARHLPGRPLRLRLRRQPARRALRRADRGRRRREQRLGRHLGGGRDDHRRPAGRSRCASRSRRSSFKRGLGAWDFNVQRRLQRLQETTRWASPMLDYAVTQMSRAGAADRPAGVRSRHRRRASGPAIRGGGGDAGARRAAGRRSPGEPRRDAAPRRERARRRSPSTPTSPRPRSTRAGPTSRASRCSFPEKRTFFLAGRRHLQLRPRARRRRACRSSAAASAWWRTARCRSAIGGKVNGRVGRTQRRRARRRGHAPSTVSRPTPDWASSGSSRTCSPSRRSGAIATFGDPLGRSGSWLAGADVNLQTSRFRGDKNFAVGVWGLATGRDDLGGDATARRLHRRLSERSLGGRL